MTTIRMIVGIGHGEYEPAFPEQVQTAIVWDASTDYGDDGVNDLDVAWVQRTGLPIEARPDADLSFGFIEYIVGERDDIEVGLDNLIAQLTADVKLKDGSTLVVPSGDDDTFDYWPSGVRLAFQIAEHVGPDAVLRVDGAARRQIAKKDASFRDEIASSCGIDWPNPVTTSDPYEHGGVR